MCNAIWRFFFSLPAALIYEAIVANRDFPFFFFTLYFHPLHFRMCVTQLKRLAEAHKFPQIFHIHKHTHILVSFSKTCTSAYYTHGILFINRINNHSSCCFKAVSTHTLTLSFQQQIC